MSHFNWSVHSSSSRCKSQPRPGPQALRRYLRERFPWLRDYGIYSCRPPSQHSDWRAWDAGIPLLAGGRADQNRHRQVISLLGPHGRRLGLDNLIGHPAGPAIYSSRSPDGRTYTGPNNHADHQHIGMTDPASWNLTYATLVSVLGRPASAPAPTPAPAPAPSPSPPFTEDDMFCSRGQTNAKVNALQRGLIHLLGSSTKVAGRTITIDSNYGPQTAQALAMALGYGSGTPPELNEYGPRQYWELHIASSRKF